MKHLTYLIDGNVFELTIPQDTIFTNGQNELLSNEGTDLTFLQPWYQEGFSVFPLLNNATFITLKDGISDSLYNILSNSLKLSKDQLEDFTLEKYHTYVTNQEQHLSIVSKTRDLFSNDFKFDIQSIVPALSNYFGFGLSDINPKDGTKMHIILRINRPHSSDYNPPHKDIYEHFDGEYGEHYVPQFINFWIPIAGLNADTSLPLSPGSHLISENKIERTTSGAKLAQGSYRVRLIKSWDGDTSLFRTNLTYGDCLVFTPHLIHGLGYNNASNVTRVALEFRLFKA